MRTIIIIGFMFFMSSILAQENVVSIGGGYSRYFGDDGFNLQTEYNYDLLKRLNFSLGIQYSEASEKFLGTESINLFFSRSLYLNVFFSIIHTTSHKLKIGGGCSYDSNNRTYHFLGNTEVIPMSNDERRTNPRIVAEYSYIITDRYLVGVKLGEYKALGDWGFNATAFCGVKF